jgi:hypothetical protein
LLLWRGIQPPGEDELVSHLRIFGGHRFFSDLKLEFDTFIESSKNLRPEYFEEKFSELESIDDPAKRGRYFDYFVGLLFNQLPEVNVYVGREVSTGEVDVFVTCLDVPDWLNRLVGDATLLENKWREEPTSTEAISVFHDKTSWATASCKVCYFISMGGFTSERNIGAKQLMQLKTDPKMVGWTREDVKQMVSKGSPEKLMRGDVM